MSIELVVVYPFPGYAKGAIITNNVAIGAILSGPYALNVVQVTVTGDDGGGHGPQAGQLDFTEDGNSGLLAALAA